MNSLSSQMLRLRRHPSVLVWLYGSDEAPPTDIEAAFLSQAAAVNWPNPLLASAANTTSPLTGNTGVKMSGPYSWEPPTYFFQTKVRDWRCGGALRKFAGYASINQSINQSINFY
jgi:exo-1,4-beta-D-glucosaminidase